MKTASFPTAAAVPALAILLFGLVVPLSAQVVVVTDLGATPPTIGTNDTGHIGTTDQRFGWDTEAVTQTFTLAEAGTIAAIYLGYNGFADGDTITLTLSVNGIDVQSGILLDGNNFSGNAATDNNAGPFYWMKFDLSTMAVPVTAGSNSFTMKATANTGVSWALAPNYKAGGNLYTGGAMTLAGAAANSDLRFAVTVQIVDADNDGLPDPYETANGTDPNEDGTLGETSPGAKDGPNGALGDKDSDGLSNFQEYKGWNTSNTPTTYGQTLSGTADSDTDGVNDGNEVSGALNAYDTDGFPVALPGASTNPLDPDTDNDTLTDGQEILTHHTSPHWADTDTDDLPDAWEVTHNLNPTVATGNDGKLGDPDSDSLGNYDEFIAGTNPSDADTDNDDYDDNVENSSLSWLDENATGTNPLKPDTDGDGLLDGQENPDTGTSSASPYDCDPNLFDTDGDFYGDGDEVTAGTNPGSGLSVPTGIPMRNIGFTNSGGGWTSTAGVALSTTSELLPGAGQYAVVDCNSADRGVTVAHGNPSAMVYCSVDFRILGTMGTTAQTFNIMDGGATGAMSQATTHCILRVFGDGSVQAFNGSAFQAVVAPGGIAAGTTYTAQIDHDVANGLWSARVVDRTTGSEIGSITGVTVRPTSSPAANPLYFTVGSQTAQTAWDVAVDNMVVSLTAIDAGIIPPSAPFSISSTGFNGANFEVTATGLDTGTQYRLTRSASLTDGFPTIVDGPRAPASATEVFIDTAPPAGKAFYRLEEAP